MSLKNAFGSQLYHKRTTRKLTQARVAEDIGISVRWYQQLEKGAFLPGTRTFLKLALYFDLDIKSFRKEVDLPERSPSESR